MNYYIASDYHFGHINICGPEGFILSRRIFETVESMNKTIIENHNAVVTNEDHTYFNGDLSMNLKPEVVDGILKSMNGSFSLIAGNHDNSKIFKYLQRLNYLMANGRMKYTFHELGIKLKKNKKVYYLTHFPLGLGESRVIYRNFCGHIHDSACYEANQLNVCIDSPELPENWPFGQPLPLDLACEILEKKWLRWKERQDRLLKG